MKYLLIATFLIAGLANGQSTPEKVKQIFSKNHPSATAIKWEKEDGNFEVSFKENSIQFSIIYNAQAILLETEQEISLSDLPASIKTYMAKHYPSNALKGAARITNAEGIVTYEAAIKRKDVIFDAAGKFVREIKG
nr:hypothetical protein [uncultured Sediminibacterium sp.]